jgi:hypothetical protein
MIRCFISLAFFSMSAAVFAQLDTYPANHSDYAAQMRYPFFMAEERFTDIRTVHGGFDAKTEDGRHLQIRRRDGRFVVMSGGRNYAEYTPMVSLRGEFQWRAVYPDRPGRTITSR